MKNLTTCDSRETIQPKHTKLYKNFIERDGVNCTTIYMGAVRSFASNVVSNGEPLKIRSLPLFVNFTCLSTQSNNLNNVEN